MKHLKLLLLTSFLLLFPQALLAQNFITSAPAGPSAPSAGMIGNGSGPIDNNFYGPENASANSFYCWDTGTDTSIGISPIFSTSASMSASGASPSAVYGLAQAMQTLSPAPT